MKVSKLLKIYKENKIAPVGKGWKPLMIKLMEDIAKIDQDTEVSQIKEKFGELRFYIYHSGKCSKKNAKKIEDLIEDAMAESLMICEHCGSRNSVKTKGLGWIKTLCDHCRNKGENI